MTTHLAPAQPDCHRGILGAQVHWQLPRGGPKGPSRHKGVSATCVCAELLANLTSGRIPRGPCLASEALSEEPTDSKVSSGPALADGCWAGAVLSRGVLRTQFSTP